MKNRIVLICLAAIFTLSLFIPLAANAQVAPPSLQLKDALTAADDALAAAKIKMDKHYLYSAVYTNSSTGPYWLLIYKSIVPMAAKEIQVKVFMDKKTEFSGGYFLQKNYY